MLLLNVEKLLRLGFVAVVPRWVVFALYVISEFLVCPMRVLHYTKEVAWQVFTPQNWDGIKVTPISLEVGDQLPKARYARSRPPPKKFEAAAIAEIERLLKYMYVPSKIPWMSDNVWAAKATAPFLRSCGDYRLVNERIRTQHAYIPDVKEELAKLRNFKYFCDFDLTNAFHQFRLDEKTSKLLSIMTINVAYYLKL